VHETQLVAHIMPAKTQILIRKRDKLKASALEAGKLAVAERLLADQQHLVASNLEVLADDLTVQVTAADAEISVAVDGLAIGLKAGHSDPTSA
jgi:hypothetical protein